jgi:hypothetical protein
MFIDSKLAYELPAAEKNSKTAYSAASPLYLGQSTGGGSFFSGQMGTAFIIIYDGKNGTPSSLPDNFDGIIKKAYKKTRGQYPPNFPAPQSPPKNYYFSTLNGNDKNNCHTKETACLSLTRLHLLWNDVQPGSSILFEKGSVFSPEQKDILTSLNALIHPPLDKSGTEDAWITIGAYGSGPKPIISTEKIDPQQRVAALAMTGAAYLDISGIEFRGHINLYAYTNFGIHHIRMTNIVMDSHVTGGRIKAFSKVINDCATVETCQTTPINNIEIGNSYFKGIHPLPQPTVANPNALEYLGGVAIVITGSQGDIWIHDNEFLAPEGNGCFDMTGGDNVVVEYNKCIVGFDKPNAVLAFKFQPGTHTVNNLLVRGNLILFKPGISYTAFIALQITNSNIYNNTIVSWPPGPDIKSVGYSAFFGDICTYFTNQTFANNNIMDNIFVGVMSIGIADGCKLSFKDGTSSVVTNKPLELNNFRNDLYYNLPGYGSNYLFSLISYSGTGANCDAKGLCNYTGPDYNDKIKTQLVTTDQFKSVWLANKGVSGDKFGDPMFIDPTYVRIDSIGNYHLKAGSPARRAGIYIPAYATDLDGIAVPAGQPPNMGCYQK